MRDQERRVLCVGEVLVDLSEDPDRRGFFTAHPGGSPLNVAVGVARLDGKVSLASPFAADGFGSRIREFLTIAGVDLALSPEATAQSTIAVASLKDGEPQYSFYRAHLPFGAFDVLDSARAESFAVIHAGSIGLLEPDVYNLVRDLFSNHFGLTTLDPNIRPSLIEDLSSYRARLMVLAAMADLVKLSVEDIQALDTSATPRAFADRLLQQGCRAVVVTAAAGGVTVYTLEGSTNVPVAGTPVVDTTGGGDAVMAALLTELALNGFPVSLRDWLPVLRFSMEVAGIACSRPGGAESMPTRGELQLTSGQVIGRSGDSGIPY